MGSRDVAFWWAELRHRIRRGERPSRAELLAAMRAAGVPADLGPAVADLLALKRTGRARGGQRKPDLDTYTMWADERLPLLIWIRTEEARNRARGIRRGALRMAIEMAAASDAARERAGVAAPPAHHTVATLTDYMRLRGLPAAFRKRLRASLVALGKGRIRPPLDGKGGSRIE